MVKKIQSKNNENSKIFSKYFLIKNFKNIGFMETTQFLLTSGFKKEEQGGLIIFIGENNSGKTNILKALNAFNYNYEFLKEDVNNELLYDISKVDLRSIVKFENKQKIKVKNMQTHPFLIMMLDNKYDDYYILMKKNEIKELLYKRENNNYLIENEQIRMFLGKVYDAFNEFKTNQSNKIEFNEYFYNYINSWLFLLDHVDFEENLQSFQLIEKCLESLCNFEKNEKFNFNENDIFSLNIFSYAENQKIDSMSIKHSEIDNNNFFISLFNILEFDFHSIPDLFKQADLLETTGLIEEKEEYLNDNLKKISKDFNKLYSFDNQNYLFKIKIEREKVTFNIWKNKKPVSLKQQSIGFKCFFQLYFEVIKNNKIIPGSIITIDEPGIHLHPKGQKELGNFLRKFGSENNILFVITTHSPFIINLDKLDEIRIVETEEKTQNVTIIDNFTLYTKSKRPCEDPMFQIKKNLTVGENVLLKPKSKIIFVEGITDYNYLTSFKLFFNNEKYNGIYFIPISGVNNKDKIQNKYSQISSLLSEYKTYAIVDGDENGQNFKQIANKNNGNLKIWTLTDINEKFIDIESLFCEKNNELLSKILKEKSFMLSSAFKKHFNFEQLSAKTIENFKSVFEFILSNT